MSQKKKTDSSDQTRINRRDFLIQGSVLGATLILNPSPAAAQIIPFNFIPKSGGGTVANWIMMQTLENALYTSYTIPQIIALPNGSTATLASYQVQSTGSIDRNCLSIINSSGTIAAYKSRGTFSSATPCFMQNNGSDNNIFHGSTSLSGSQFQSATLDGSTYTYGTAQYFDDLSTGWNLERSRARTGKDTIGFSSSYLCKFSQGTMTQCVPGYNTGTWSNPSYTGQADVDGSGNMAYVVRASSGGADTILFGRITGATYNAYSFLNQGSVPSSLPRLAVASDNSAIIGYNQNSTTVEIVNLSSTPAMAHRYQYSVASGSLALQFVAIDPDDSDAAYLLYTTDTANELILSKISISTGAIGYKKSFVFSGWSNISDFQMHVYNGCLYMAIRSSNFTASKQPICFFAKLDKSTINNGTYTISSISSTYGRVVISTFGTTINLTGLGNLSLTTVSTTRSSYSSATVNSSAGQQGQDFFGSGTTTV